MGRVKRGINEEQVIQIGRLRGVRRSVLRRSAVKNRNQKGLFLRGGKRLPLKDPPRDALGDKD